MRTWWSEWYNKYAVVASSAAAGMGAYHSICWSKLTASDWGTWMAAIGTIAAFAGTIYLARRGDVQRRQEPILALSAILRQADYFGRILPMSDLPEMLELKTFFSQVNVKKIDGIQRALDRFPIDRLLDYSSVDALFGMQDAMHLLESIVKIADQPEEMWRHLFFLNLQQRRRVSARIGLAMAHLEAVRNGAGIRF